MKDKEVKNLRLNVNMLTPNNYNVLLPNFEKAV